jgi:hypothetical protein
MVEGGGPVLDGPAPPLTGFHDGQVQHLPHGVRGRKRASLFRHLAHLGVDGFNRVGRVDNLPDFGRVVEERPQISPVRAPHATDLREPAAPALGERPQGF